jgi:hypothetical protein
VNTSVEEGELQIKREEGELQKVLKFYIIALFFPLHSINH